MRIRSRVVVWTGESPSEAIDHPNFNSMSVGEEQSVPLIPMTLARSNARSISANQIRFGRAAIAVVSLWRSSHPRRRLREGSCSAHLAGVGKAAIARRAGRFAYYVWNPERNERSRI